MLRIEETAYPRLKQTVSPRDLASVYTPTWDEVTLANEATTGTRARVCFLALLKTYQRLGYAAPLADVPPAIVEHIARSVNAGTVVLDQAALAAYDAAGTRRRHLAVIRDYLRVRPFDATARRIMLHALADAARTKGDLIDLINVAIEELVRQRYELPVFDTLNRAARKVRATLARDLYRRVSAALPPAARAQIDALFIADLTTRRTPWNDLKTEPGRPTRTHLRDLIARERWLSARNVGAGVLATIPAVRVQHLATEARTLDAARMMALEPHKRYTLAAPLLAVQTAMACSSGRPCPAAHAVANAASPSTVRTAAMMRSYLARSPAASGAKGTPIALRRAAAAPKSRTARSGWPCASATPAMFSRHSTMPIL